MRKGDRWQAKPTSVDLLFYSIKLSKSDVLRIVSERRAKAELGDEPGLLIALREQVHRFGCRIAELEQELTAMKAKAYEWLQLDSASILAFNSSTNEPMKAGFAKFHEWCEQESRPLLRPCSLKEYITGLWQSAEYLPSTKRNKTSLLNNAIKLIFGFKKHTRPRMRNRIDYEAKAKAILKRYFRSVDEQIALTGAPLTAVVFSKPLLATFNGKSIRLQKSDKCLLSFYYKKLNIN